MKIIPPLAYGEDAAAEAAEIGTAPDNSAAEMTARFIIGDADIEATVTTISPNSRGSVWTVTSNSCRRHSTVSDKRQYSWWVKKAENDIRLIKVRPRNRKNRHIS